MQRPDARSPSFTVETYNKHQHQKTHTTFFTAFAHCLVVALI